MSIDRGGVVSCVLVGLIACVVATGCPSKGGSSGSGGKGGGGTGATGGTGGTAAGAGGGTAGSGTGGMAGSESEVLDAHTMSVLDRAKGKPKPIADTHIHLFQPSRSGVVWPDASNTVLYKDSLPQGYMDKATPLGILGSGIVEASPFLDDT